MKTLLLVTLLSGFLLSCTQKVSNNSKEETINNIDNADLKEILYKRKAEVDTLFNRNIKAVKVLVKVPGRDELVEIKNEKWPEEIEITYNLLTDSTGRIIKVLESPFSESGDWDIVYSHYFDNNGNTYANERIVSAFNTFCPDGVIIEGVSRETIVKLYNANQTLIDSTYKMVDENAADIIAKKCQQEVSSENIQFYSLQSYLKSRNIKTRE